MIITPPNLKVGLKSALSFDPATSDYVELEGTGATGANPINLDDDFSIDFAFYPTGSASSYLIGNYRGTGDYEGQWITIDVDARGSGVDIGIGVDDNTTMSIAVTGELPLSQWYHIHCARDKGNAIKIYVNAVEADSVADNTTGSVLSDKPWTFGRRSLLPAAEEFAGILSNVRLYSRLCTASEIKLLSIGMPISTYGLAGFWRMDEGSGTTAYDRSGNANHGTLNGSPTWTTDTPW